MTTGRRDKFTAVILDPGLPRFARAPGCQHGGNAMHDVPGSVHWHEPRAGQRAGFGKFGRPKTPYDLFMEQEGIPVFRDIGVRRVQDLPLAEWRRLGGRGTYIQLHGTEGKWGCYVVEVPGAGALHPEKHLYEEIFYVVEGREIGRAS